MTAWIAARSTLMAVHQDNPRQAIEAARRHQVLALPKDEHLAPILLDSAVAVGRLLGPERARVREAIRARL